MQPSLSTSYTSAKRKVWVFGSQTLHQCVSHHLLMQVQNREQRQTRLPEWSRNLNRRKTVASALFPSHSKRKKRCEAMFILCSVLIEAIFLPGPEVPSTDRTDVLGCPSPAPPREAQPRIWGLHRSDSEKGEKATLCST